ncbi:MAG: polymer-forming cytoskeletal protein [Pseudomonadota bacterium]
MFSKAKSKDKDAAKEAKSKFADEPAPVPAASQQKRQAAPRSGVPSIISADVVLKGAMEASGEVQLDGRLEGDITAAALIIGEQASVTGDVVCENVTVRGRVEGGIRARSVTLASTAQIDGDILHSALSVETGAHFEGNCRHSDDPLSDAAAQEFRSKKTFAAPQAAPQAAQKQAFASRDGDAQDSDRASGGHKPFQPQSSPRSPLR